MNKENRKNIFLWSLYDLANSIVVIVFFIYFSQWLVIEKGVSDFWYNMIFVGGTIILVLVSPPLGIMADKKSRNIGYLRLVTIIVYILFLLISISTNIKPEWVLISGLIYMVGNAMYQLCFTFYNPLIDQLSNEENRGKISGIGHATNWLGQIIGILIAIPFASGALYLFSEPGRAQTFLPASLIFIALSLPMLIFFKEKNDVNVVEEKISYIKALKESFFKLRIALKDKSVGPFMIAFFFFNDAILTASNNFPIYLERVFNTPDKTKSFLLAGILLTSAVGAYVGGLIADKVGLKKTMLRILLIWMIILPALGITKNFTIFSGIVLFMGFNFGASWSVSRAFLSTLVPKEMNTYSFSLYTISERFASFAGPLTWGLILLLPKHNALNYRLAIISMTVFVIIGYFFMRKVVVKYA